MYNYLRRRGKVDTNGFHHVFKSVKEQSHLPGRAEIPSLLPAGQVTLNFFAQADKILSFPVLDSWHSASLL